MTGRKAVVGLSLLCALVFSAFGAASASAKGTTAVECSSAAVTKDFSDAHCDTPATPQSNFGHIAFENGKETSVSAANDLTGTLSSFLLKGKIAAVFTEVTCEKVAGTGSVTNKEAAEVMSVTFGKATTEFTVCKVLAPPAAVGKCTVTVNKTESLQSDPMTLGLGAEKTPPQGGAAIKVLEEGKGTEMGLKFSPTAVGGKFTILNFTGAECPAAVKGEKPVEGSALALGGRGGLEATSSSGATAKFTQASTLGGLTFAGNPATLEGTLTFRKTGGNPLSVTTTTK